MPASTATTSRLRTSTATATTSPAVTRMRARTTSARTTTSTTATTSAARATRPAGTPAATRAACDTGRSGTRPRPFGGSGQNLPGGPARDQQLIVERGGEPGQPRGVALGQRGRYLGVVAVGGRVGG